jgi:RNA polymerase sigma-70 factor, ECF subfamily
VTSPVDEPLLDLSRYWDILRWLAARNLDARLRRLVEPSDLAQETLLRAHAKLHQFRGSSPGELQAWLRAILANVMAEVARKHLGGGKELEESLNAALEESSARLEQCLAAAGPSPSQQVLHEEQILLLMRAIDRLPEDQRAAVDLRYLQGHPPPEVARLLGRTTASAAGLLRRGLDALRQALGDGD